MTNYDFKSKTKPHKNTQESHYLCCICVLYPHQFMYEYVLIYSSAENHYYKSQQYGEELHVSLYHG